MMSILSIEFKIYLELLSRGLQYTIRYWINVLKSVVETMVLTCIFGI